VEPAGGLEVSLAVKDTAAPGASVSTLQAPLELLLPPPPPEPLPQFGPVHDEGGELQLGPVHGCGEAEAAAGEGEAAAGEAELAAGTAEAEAMGVDEGAGADEGEGAGAGAGGVLFPSRRRRPLLLESVPPLELGQLICSEMPAERVSTLKKRWPGVIATDEIQAGAVVRAGTSGNVT
jgi:hypothetical protein